MTMNALLGIALFSVLSAVFVDMSSIVKAAGDSGGGVDNGGENVIIDAVLQGGSGSSSRDLGMDLGVVGLVEDD